MKFYTSLELAELLRMSIHTVRDKISRGDFGATVNTGRMHLVSQENLDAYIKEHTELPNPHIVLTASRKVRHFRPAGKL